ncbi:hypothetical protein PG994_006495 [Apiospora phragmitis]|uniref:Uncharacterized protein n=1 Tax=Apiospora phragmitis TaxID=2905665 RepID=A0ABR1VF76_9PEZI
MGVGMIDPLSLRVLDLPVRWAPETLSMTMGRSSQMSFEKPVAFAVFGNGIIDLSDFSRKMSHSPLVALVLFAIGKANT